MIYYKYKGKNSNAIIAGAYIIALVSLTIIESYYLDYKYAYSLYLGICVTFVLNALILSICYIIGDSERKRRQAIRGSIAIGFIAWVYITILPEAVITLLRTIHEYTQSALLGIHVSFVFIQIIIGGFIIHRFKLPKALILIALILPGFANLYYLVYGIYKRSKDKPVTVLETLQG